MGKKTYLNWNSPVLNLNFNTVEGYNTYYDIFLSKSFAKDKKFKLGGKVAYSLARNKITGNGYFKLDYGPTLQKGHFNIEGGQYVFQINPDQPIFPLINSFMTLLFQRNYMKLYQKDYIKIENDKYIRPNFRLITDVEWADRQFLQNQNIKGWINNDKRIFTPNAPHNLELDSTSFQQHKSVIAHIGFEFQPWQRYSIENGNRKISNDGSPLFSLHYRKGIPNIASSIIDFDHIEIGYKQKLEIGIRGILSFQTKLGHFFNNKSITFLDYKHFHGNQTPFTTTDPVEAFRIMDYYAYSTNETYFIGQAHYQFRKFLATQIPAIRFLGIKENVFVNYLGTAESQHYTEIGYSIDYILRIFRLEFVTSYKDFKYDNWGIRIGIGTDLGGMLSID